MTPKQKKQSGSTKRKSSSRNSTPKRQRIFSPYLKSCSPFKASPRKPRCSKLHHLVLQKLEALGMDKYFISFLTLVEEGTFPLNNLSFLLFLETVRFFSNSCTTKMRYFPERKRVIAQVHQRNFVFLVWIWKIQTHYFFFSLVNISNDKQSRFRWQWGTWRIFAVKFVQNLFLTRQQNCVRHQTFGSKHVNQNAHFVLHSLARTFAFWY